MSHGVICINPKFRSNVGMILRLSAAFNSQFFYYTGDRAEPELSPKGKIRLPREERMEEYSKVHFGRHEQALHNYTALGYINKLNSNKCQRCKFRLDGDFFCSPCHETCVCSHMRLYHRYAGSKCILCALNLNPDEECEIFSGSRTEEYQAATAFLGEDYFE